MTCCENLKAPSLSLIVMASVDVVQLFETLKGWLDKRCFKKGKIRIAIDRSTSELERRETIIEGYWDAWIDSPPSIILKEARMYDEIRTRAGPGKYVVENITSEYSKEVKRKNLREMGDLCVSANIILWVELPSE